VEVHGQDFLGQVNIARYDANTTVNAASNKIRDVRSRDRRSSGTREQQAEFVRDVTDFDAFDFRN